MCGLAGFVRWGDGVAGGDLADALEEASRRLAHRGPDGRGRYDSPTGRAGLAFRRLAVIDLAGGDQPIANETQDIHLVLNGEIYGFEAVRERLEAAGHRFRTRSDAEVALHLYEDHGPDCVTHLRGMFALAIWDETRGRLLLARDRKSVV